MPKYKLTENTKTTESGVVLHQIQRFDTAELGGWIEAEKNLSQDGTCWVSDNAQVYGSA